MIWEGVMNRLKSGNRQEGYKVYKSFCFVATVKKHRMGKSQNQKFPSERNHWKRVSDGKLIICRMKFLIFGGGGEVGDGYK
jgi:hypothetical protein